jgi:YVTN family beta-propeller protein
MGGVLSRRAEVDLNSYLAVTLNHDDTITFINPLISFSKTKLENIIPLPGRGADWTLANNNALLYVTMPEQSAVAIINTNTRKLIGTISTGEKTKPMRITLQPDGRRVWVGLDGSPLVAVIDTTTNKLAAKVTVGSGLHNIAFTSDNRFAYVSNSSAGSVSAIDIKTLNKVADISAGEAPIPVAYSETSRLVYVAAINGPGVSVIDPASQGVVTTIPLSRGIVALRFAPDGRFAFAVNQIESIVSVIDASTNTIIGSTPVVKDPDQVSFTRKYAYIRGLGSEKFSLIDLNDAALGKLAPLDIQAGRQTPNTMPGEIGVSEMIAPTPEGNAVMIANAPDQMLYYYVEGMMAPMGTFSNYKRRPRALLILDRSLAELAPGVYSVAIKLAGAGDFDVPMLIDQPRLMKCFQLTINESATSDRNASITSINIKFMPVKPKVVPGVATTFKMKIVDSVTKKPITGLEDVLMLAFEPPGIWQQRQWAKESGKGVYEVSQSFPRAGLYSLMVGVSSRGVSVGDLDPLLVPVVDQTNTPAKKAKAERGTEK